MAGKISVTLKKSLTGRHDKHIATARSLGLRRIGDKTLQPDNAQTRGKLNQICYLVAFEELPAVGQAKKPAAKPKKAAPASEQEASE